MLESITKSKAFILLGDRDKTAGNIDLIRAAKILKILDYQKEAHIELTNIYSGRSTYIFLVEPLFPLIF